MYMPFCSPLGEGRAHSPARRIGAFFFLFPSSALVSNVSGSSRTPTVGTCEVRARSGAPGFVNGESESDDCMRAA